MASSIEASSSRAEASTKRRSAGLQHSTKSLRRGFGTYFKQRFIPRWSWACCASRPGLRSLARRLPELGWNRRIWSAIASRRARRACPASATSPPTTRPSLRGVSVRRVASAVGVVAVGVSVGVGRVDCIVDIVYIAGVVGIVGIVGAVGAVGIVGIVDVVGVASVGIVGIVGGVGVIDAVGASAVGSVGVAVMTIIAFIVVVVVVFGVAVPASALAIKYAKAGAMEALVAERADEWRVRRARALREATGLMPCARI